MSRGLSEMHKHFQEGGGCQRDEVDGMSSGPQEGGDSEGGVDSGEM